MGSGDDDEQGPQQLAFSNFGSIPEERYGTDHFGANLGFDSAGPLALLTRDQLHPLLVDDAAIWSDGRRWYEGAVAHTVQAAQLCELQQGQLVLDVGCGLGGPARTLVDRYDVNVVGMNKVFSQQQALRNACGDDGRWATQIHPLLADADHGWPVRQVDVVWSMNMLYHLEDHRHFLREARRVLPVGGVLMVDDWMYTDRTTAATEKAMAFHFSSSNLAQVRGLIRGLSRNGFQVTDMIDCGIVARTTMRDHFRSTFDRDFRDEFARVDPTWGPQLAKDFVEAIEATLDMYVAEELTYIQVVARAI